MQHNLSSKNAAGDRPGPGTALGDMPVTTVDGEQVTLATYAGPLLVVQFVRYFGCLPCQVYLRELDGREADLALVGARALAVGGSAAYQARWLHDTGVKMPLLLDPDQRLRRAVGFGSLSRRQLLAPRGMRSYASAVLSGVRPKRPTSDITTSPGIAILDAALAVRWTYEGMTLGDYPPLDTVLEAAAHMTSQAAGSRS